MGHTCGEPNEIELTAAHRLFYRSFSRAREEAAEAVLGRGAGAGPKHDDDDGDDDDGDDVDFNQHGHVFINPHHLDHIHHDELQPVRVPSRSIPLQRGPIRFRPPIHTYAPWSVRVDELAQSGETPTRKPSPLFFAASRSTATKSSTSTSSSSSSTLSSSTTTMTTTTTTTMGVFECEASKKER